MKRYNNIFEKIITMDNLRKAHSQARKGKLHYKEVRMVDKNPDFYLKQIQEMLINRTYKTSDYTVFTVVDKGKEREIYKLPYFPDRIVQWAIMLQIEEILLKTLIHDTYAALPNRGIHKALNKLHTFMNDREGTMYCLKIDVKKFFPSIDKEILKSMLRRKFKDIDLLNLLDEIIDSSDKGVPIGNYTSQYFGNFYLSYFDHWLKEVKGIKYYLRYMDDCVILHHDKNYLHQLKAEIEEYIQDNLNLELKDNWQVFPTYVRGIDFVGYRSFGKYTLLRKSTSKNLKRKMRTLNKRNERPNDLNSIMSYRGWLEHCNGHNLAVKYIDPILFRRYEHDCKK